LSLNTLHEKYLLVALVDTGVSSGMVLEILSHEILVELIIEIKPSGVTISGHLPLIKLDFRPFHLHNSASRNNSFGYFILMNNVRHET
jgi:hypothetical protein